MVVPAYTFVSLRQDLIPNFYWRGAIKYNVPQQQLEKKGTLMAKLLGPDFLSLQVCDLVISRAFYIDLLGFTEDPHFRAPGFVLFDTTTIPFGISEACVNLDEAVHLGWGVALWIDCANVDGRSELSLPATGRPSRDD